MGIFNIKTLGDIAKFSWAEMFNDNTGKTCVSSFAGLIVTLIGAGTFAYTTIIKSLELTTQSVIVIGIGAALLGVNKVMNGKPPVDVQPPTE